MFKSILLLSFLVCLSFAEDEVEVPPEVDIGKEGSPKNVGLVH